MQPAQSTQVISNMDSNLTFDEYDRIVDKNLVILSDDDSIISKPGFHQIAKNQMVAFLI